jgi:hypothetical protein
MSDAVSPHTFRPLQPWDALRRNGRCKRCFLPRVAHPIHNAWVPARPLGDKRRAELSWENLHGGDTP